MKNIIKTTSAILIAIYCFACSSETTVEYGNKTADDFVNEAKSKITEISIDTFYRIYTSEMFYLVDVRTQSEHNSGFIPGSISIPRGVVEFRIDNEAIWEAEELYMPLKEELIIVYCKKGSRAAMVVDVLHQMGYTNVKSILGGWNAWKEQYPDQVEVKHVAGSEAAHAEESGGC